MWHCWQLTPFATCLSAKTGFSAANAKDDAATIEATIAIILNCKLFSLIVVSYSLWKRVNGKKETLPVIVIL